MAEKKPPETPRGRYVPPDEINITSEDVTKLIDSLPKESIQYWSSRLPDYKTKDFQQPNYWFKKISDREDRMDEQLKKKHAHYMSQPISRGEFVDMLEKFQEHMNGAINNLEMRVGEVVGALRDAMSSGTSRREVVIRALMVKNLITQEEIDIANAEMDTWQLKVEELMNPNLPWDDKLDLIVDWNAVPGNMEIHARDLGFDNYIVKGDGKELPYTEKIRLSEKAKMPKEFMRLLEVSEQVRIEHEKEEKSEAQKQDGGNNG